MPRRDDETTMTPIIKPVGQGSTPKPPNITAFKDKTVGPNIDLSADPLIDTQPAAEKPRTARKKAEPKPKPGRKKKDPKLKESEILALKLTKDELKIIQDKAGLTALSTYVKHYIRTQTDLFKPGSGL